MGPTGLSKLHLVQCTVSANFKNKENYIKTALFKFLNIHTDRRRIKLIEDNAKCRHRNKMTCKGTLRHVFICLWTRTPYPPPLHTITFIHYIVLLIHTRKGGGGRVEPERRLEGQQFISWPKISTWLTASINLINNCRKGPLQVNILDDEILLWFLHS